MDGKPENKTSAAQLAATRRYMAKAVDKYTVTARKGHRAAWERKAAERGQSLNGWIVATLDSAAGIDGPGAGDSPKE